MDFCDTTLDLMIEQEVDRMWAEQNVEPTKPLDTVSRKKLLRAIALLDVAEGVMLKHTLEDMDRAIEIVKNTPEGDRLASLYDDLTNLKEHICEIEKKMDENWRNR